jgi:hypothetical protein
MNEPRPLHRLFGLTWIDFFEGTGIDVETEMDLSAKQQFVDLVFSRKGPEPIPRPLPDGFEDLAPHNLVTFKSHQEALDSWALCELVGHYVNHRKQVNPSMQDLPPESDFRLFAVCARYPHNLAQETPFTNLREGVYEVRMAALRIRVIVLNQLAQTEQNAMLHLFSAREELLRYGRQHYRPHSREISTLLFEWIKENKEAIDMSDKHQALIRQAFEDMFPKIALELRVKGLSVEERLTGLPAEERLKGLPAEERLKGLSAEELLKGLSPEIREALIQQLKANGTSNKPE